MQTAEYPKLYGERGWVMIYQLEPGVTRRVCGPTLCDMTFGRIADAISDIARACRAA